MYRRHDSSIEIIYIARLDVIYTYACIVMCIYICSIHEYVGFLDYAVIYSYICSI